MDQVEMIRQASRPLAPLETGVAPQLAPLDGIRAVVLDVYGTLLVSASGDISLTSGVSRGDAICDALTAMGVAFEGHGDEAVEVLHAVIGRHHAESEVDYPEVEIREVWRDALAEFVAAGWIATADQHLDRERLAIEYEMRVNPVWPMPGLAEFLETIRKSRLTLGIISNAQFFTPLLFQALVGGSPQELGFAPSRCWWSYVYRQAKPGRYLYEQAAATLAVKGLAASEVLYVGNDMRNDIAPAAAVGFRTALFAGDDRSLRWRRDDALVAGVTPDRIVTELRQILTILRLAD